MDRNRQHKMRPKNTKDRRENKDKRSMPKNIVETPSKNNENLRNPKTSKKNFPKSISSEKLPMQMRKNDMNERMPESEYKPRMKNKNKIRDNVNSSFDNNGISYKRNSISKKMNEKMNKENNQSDKIPSFNLNNNFERNKTNMNDINNNRRGGRNNYNNNAINNFNNNDKGKNISNFSLINTINEINNRTQNKNFDILNKNNLFFSPSHQNNYNNDESQKKLRSASVDKPNVTYSNFINNLKKQMKINQEAGNLDSKFKNKKKKNVFYDFLNQFVNKEKAELQQPKNAFNNNMNNMNNIPNITNKNNVNINPNNNIQINTNNNTNNNTANNTNHNTNRNPNKVRKFRNVHKNRITNFCIPASGIKNFNNYNNYGNSSELLSMKKELEKRDSKIKELVSIIENWNSAYNAMAQENQKLKEEIYILKNGSNIYDQNNDNNANNKNDVNKYNINNQNSNFDSSHSNINEKAQINNLITYNINKNNNYNIINSDINNFNNFVQNQNINNRKPIGDNQREPLKENEQERKARKERKASIAFERYKKMNRMNSTEKEIQKSDKISDMAKMLENHIGGPRKENSVDVGERIEGFRNNINNDLNNEVVNIIDSQPVVNKKKKKMRSFSYES